ncbi:MAG: hypothetical protein HY399_05515, partial [Elusimicrobia bacterium]|nr:hypothetical protein [Elusimicrobiota bacterium]
YCWALQENCVHDVSERLPCYWGGIPGYSRGCSAVHLCEDGGNDLCWNDPTQARLTYVVTLNPDQSRKVVVTASWNE